MNGYGLGDTIKIFFSLIYTKLFWKHARLVRLPIMARNRNKIRISEGFTSGTNCRLNPGVNGYITFGKNFTMGDQCQIEAMKSVTFGDDVLLASKVFVGDSSHGIYSGAEQSSPDEVPNKRVITAKPITIGDRVWIGNSVTILGGVVIGNGAVIGANAVVTADVPENSIVVGCPARVIKKFNRETNIWERV